MSGRRGEWCAVGCVGGGLIALGIGVCMRVGEVSGCVVFLLCSWCGSRAGFRFRGCGDLLG